MLHRVGLSMRMSCTLQALQIFQTLEHISAAMTNKLCCLGVSLSPVQIVILGTGAADYEARVKEADRDYGWFCRGHVGFSVPLGHKIMAGCDILLMPSR
jgi:glycogen synthase